MANFEDGELLLMSETDAQSYDETLHSKFQRLLSRTQSASVSIPMESYERKTSIVGHSGSLYANATPGTDNLLQHSIVVTGNKTEESKTDKFATFISTDKFDSKNEHLLISGELGICNDPYCTTCPTYFEASQLRNPKASILSDPKDFNCIVVNWKLTKALVIVRSMNDFIYCLNILLQFRLAFVSPESRVVGAGDLVDHPKKIALRYLKGYFLIDLFVVFPLPQRVNQCFRNACHTSNIPGCLTFIDCGHSHNGHNQPGLSSNQWNNHIDAIACWNSSSGGSFAYGIYANAVPLTTQTDMVIKYIYALFWGLQQISTLAGNQTPSDFVWEVLFTMAIVGLGLFLFALLIGNIQNFLQGLGRRRLEMQLRSRDVEQWMSHRRLPEYLRRKVREAERYSWTATRGVNEAVLMENFPEDLQVDIRRHLFKFVKKVSTRISVA
ncbi:hypothetical protein JHK82_045593 [Glycine max]|nr:hypothetical protein JHK85_046564 [Glycine max]KAG5100541.1 hypothetical protein JHK82_045593 [Glycine max]KAG5109126.1 hypothetical protein JHK84_046033 [Glycine max]